MLFSLDLQNLYVRTVKICYFSMNFVHVKEIVYSELLVITMSIIYKTFLRGLQENESKKVECQLINSGFDNQNITVLLKQMETK